MLGDMIKENLTTSVPRPATPSTMQDTEDLGTKAPVTQVVGMSLRMTIAVISKLGGQATTYLNSR